MQSDLSTHVINYISIKEKDVLNMQAAQCNNITLSAHPTYLSTNLLLHHSRQLSSKQTPRNPQYPGSSVPAYIHRTTPGVNFSSLDLLYTKPTPSASCLSVN